MPNREPVRVQQPNLLHAMPRMDRHPQIAALSHQRIQHPLPAVAHRKQFPRLLSPQLDAHVLEPAYRRLLTERRQDVTDNVPPTVIVFRPDRLVCEVTPTAARHEDLGSEAFGPIEHGDPQRRTVPLVRNLAGSDSSREPRGTRANDYDVMRLVHVISIRGPADGHHMEVCDVHQNDHRQLSGLAWSRAYL